MATKEEYVTFLDSEGNEISNDPRWKAEKVLKDAGVSANAGSEEVQGQLDEANAKIAALEAALAGAQASEDLEDDEEESDGDYSDVKGPALVKLAKERGVSLKNDDGSNRKAGEVREALVAADKS